MIPSLVPKSSLLHNQVSPTPNYQEFRMGFHRLRSVLRFLSSHNENYRNININININLYVDIRKQKVFKK